MGFDEQVSQTVTSYEWRVMALNTDRSLFLISNLCVWRVTWKLQVKLGCCAYRKTVPIPCRDIPRALDQYRRSYCRATALDTHQLFSHTTASVYLFRPPGAPCPVEIQSLTWGHYLTFKCSSIPDGLPYIFHPVFVLLLYTYPSSTEFWKWVVDDENSKHDACLLK